MTELYSRVLMWHKLVAQTTGGLALCSARHKLNRAEALDWVEKLRNVSDEIDSVIQGRGFILDDRGQRVVVYVVGTTAYTEETNADGSGRGASQVAARSNEALRHAYNPSEDDITDRKVDGGSGTTGRKAGGPRRATKKS